ncbi:putative Mfs allantoate protein [Seiridium cardinale]
MAVPSSACQAINLSDSQPCTEPATSTSGLFCQLHQKQAMGLYLGYKRRNAKLDNLPDKAPVYLKEAKVPLGNDGFETITEVKVLQEVHDHLFEEYVLLGKVVDARKLHHKHFYPLQMDYGHQAYLDKLSSRRNIVLRALERLDKRTAEVLYEQEKWFTWVRQVQNEEETNREKEARKVKLEAAMFKRHLKKLQVRLQRQREKEDKLRQESALEAAYRERQSISSESDEDAEMWDPIEDLADDSRSQYIDLIRHFLWMESETTSLETSQPQGQPVNSEASSSKKLKKKPKAKSGSGPTAKKSNANNGPVAERAQGQEKIRAMLGEEPDDDDEGPEPNKGNIETEAEMRKRLADGVAKNYDDVYGAMVVGTIENPVETYARVPPMPEDEIDAAVKDIKEIKLLLFCRLLLSHATLLPAALKANSVEEFLRESDVPESDLRDLCLRVEQPSLQDIRDACADLSRGDDVDENEDIANDEEDESLAEILWHERRFGHLQGKDYYKQKIQAHAEKVAAFSPGQRKEEAKQQRMKIRVCGKSIWNYSSEKSMSRDGWLQFSIMAKDCDLRNAIQLCRNWDEFSEVNMLTIWQYFPAPNWVSWGNDRLTQQLHELGFFPYFQDFSAARTSKHLQVGARSSLRRQHDIVETRNIIVGHMKRNDPVTQRFLQYCLMRAGDMLVLVRDGKTGKVLTCPNEEHLFTYRVKQGLGRASKNEYEDILNVGPEYFAVVDRLRKWRFGFDDYYDVWLWDYAPGREGIDMYNLLISELRKAWQITKPSDVYKHMQPLLSSIAREPITKRVHQVKAGEESIWDELWSSGTKFLYTDLSKGPQMMPASEADLAKMSPHMFYSPADAAEDAIIFPHKEGSKSWLFKEISNPISEMSDSPPAWMQFYCANFKTYISGDVVANHNPENEYDLYEDDDMDWEDEEDDEILGDDDSFHDSDVYSLGGNSDDGERSDQRLPEGVSNLWKLPNIWADALGMIQVEGMGSDKKKLLRSVGIASEKTGLMKGAPTHLRAIRAKYKSSDRLELMERKRCFAFVKSFHACDTETGGQDKYAEISEFLSKLQAHDNPTGSTSWFWYLVSILELLELRADYEDYNPDGFAPWPHAFIIQDLVGTFAGLAPFFQELEVCSPAVSFLNSPEGRKFRDSMLLKQSDRSQVLPERRSRTSFKYRPKSFWKEWQDILDRK